MSAKAPPTIQRALEMLSSFVTNPYKFSFMTYSRPGKPRLMRSERRESMLAVLTAMVEHVDLVSGRIVRPIGRDKDNQIFADCSLSWLADAAGVSQRTLCRVIVDLEAVGWLKRENQAILNGVEEGTLAVATVVRRLTETFFSALGLLKMFLRDQAYLRARRPAKMIKSLCRIVSTNIKSAWNRVKPSAPKPIQIQLAELDAWIKRNNSPSSG